MTAKTFEIQVQDKHLERIAQARKPILALAELIWNAVDADARHNDEQQAILALHRMRQELAKFRSAQINSLRDPLTEYGAVMPVLSVRSSRPWRGSRSGCRQQAGRHTHCEHR